MMAHCVYQSTLLSIIRIEQIVTCKKDFIHLKCIAYTRILSDNRMRKKKISSYARDSNDRAIDTLSDNTRVS